MPNNKFYFQAGADRVYPRSILYLDVRRDPDRLLNGVLFVVDEPALAAFDQREWIYDRIDITRELERVRVEGGQAYVYAGKSGHRIPEVAGPEVAAVRATYLGMLEDGLAAHGSEFRAEYDASTDPVPPRLVIDDKID
jgi:hypothetical protein